jgi:hypothetical protein
MIFHVLKDEFNLHVLLEQRARDHHVDLYACVHTAMKPRGWLVRMLYRIIIIIGCVPALADDDRVTKVELERRGHVGRNVLVALLITVVLLDVMKVVTADDDSPVPQKRKESTFDARDVSPVLFRTNFHRKGPFRGVTK